ncbi:MAG TPA: carbon-nitrogen hydrolase family protein [Oceanicaulis sp.]|uniref:Carbon-nitrogen hydrolase n=1 Tax=Glycocaulis albus TaxID=1382801 RepID=A0ABQ1XQT4_9PROT|nr:nitrilase-related carbon-nitrogen hydrolase [Glycocaulis albus]MBV5257394.1 carbon-nitrogen hydrolase family protein [Synechococcus moorigangaii CMS01]GGH00411.1 carbon-nitrogen hydrolase [Glycocaulis albus]HCY54166.1 carbon-nitrogen hydrolase family protein [Oceanicaulis sp.]
MPRWLIFFACIVIAALAGWSFWRALPAPDAPVADPIVVSETGSRTNANLIAVEPVMRVEDYTSAQAFRARLADYLDAAREAGVLTPQTIAVFPEHIATWLVAADAPRAVYRARSVDGAMIALIAANPLPYAGSLLASGEPDRAAAAVFRMRSADMAQAYQAAFSALAEEYAITIVAGSVVLAGARIEAGAIVADTDGPLENVGAVFAPDGRVHGALVRKAYPIPSEAGFTAAASLEDYPLFETPAGRLGVLICADSWHPDVYAAIDDAELLAVPAFLQPGDVWDAPWGGYVTPWPDDVPRGEAGRLTEGEAWQTHALAGRLQDTSARAGITAFLGGSLWGMGSDGAAIAVDREGIHTANRTSGGQVLVMWVGE